MSQSDTHVEVFCKTVPFFQKQVKQCLLGEFVRYIIADLILLEQCNVIALSYYYQQNCFMLQFEQSQQDYDAQFRPVNQIDQTWNM